MITVFTNNENEYWEAKQKWAKHTNIHYILGDIRDFELVLRASYCADYVFNCAAIKHVSICEDNPEYAYDVNVNGLLNILDAMPTNFVQVSTDKAVEPTSVMGTTKKLGEKLVLTRGYSFVRFGNVLGSRGSIVPIVIDKLKNGRLIPLTHPEMSRYFITLKEAAKFIIDTALYKEMGFGYVPKLKQVKIIDMINEIAKEEGYNIGDYHIEIIGRTPGEKLVEKLISDTEDYTEKGEVYIIK